MGTNGRLTEWSIVLAWKARVRETVPQVRILNLPHTQVVEWLKTLVSKTSPKGSGVRILSCVLFLSLVLENNLGSYHNW